MRIEIETTDNKIIISVNNMVKRVINHPTKIPSKSIILKTSKILREVSRDYK